MSELWLMLPLVITGLFARRDFIKMQWKIILLIDSEDTSKSLERIFELCNEY